MVTLAFQGHGYLDGGGETAVGAGMRTIRPRTASAGRKPPRRRARPATDGRPGTTTLRRALYARYSSDQQKAASFEDQFRVGRKHAEREGETIAGASGTA